MFDDEPPSAFGRAIFKMEDLACRLLIMIISCYIDIHKILKITLTITSDNVMLSPASSSLVIGLGQVP